MDYKNKKLVEHLEILQMQMQIAKWQNLKKKKLSENKIFLWITNNRNLVMYSKSHKCKCQKAKLHPETIKLTVQSTLEIKNI